MTDLSPERRNIAQVFQFPVIYDTMTVAENLAFPLRNRRVPEAEIGRRVAAMLERLGLADKAGRKARGLTQGQVSEASGLTQPMISKLEAPVGAIPQLDSVMRYVAACDGKLELDFALTDIDEAVSLELDQRTHVARLVG